MSNKLDFGPSKEIIDGSNILVFVSHEFTDADDLGSMLALAEVLEKSGKQIFICSRGGLPDNLYFLPGSEKLLDAPPDIAYDTVCFFGCGEIRRPGFEDWNLDEKKIINIDHHVDNKLYGDANLVDEFAAATCEVVYKFIKYSGEDITKSIAINLLAGIFFDTGGFRHASTTPEILEIAADLVRRGARIDRIAKQYFGQNELIRMKAWAKAFENARFDEEQKMMYSTVTEEELAEIGARPEHLEGIAEILNTVPEAKFAMFLKQGGDEIRASLRSENYKGVDVSEIARRFGGGGHKLAAGFKLTGKMEKTKEGWKIT
ncbi:MAG: hypothetical protein A2826_00835 [Candidatus Doudnabacteria bacterium RIFCSPHIGHO2_01_FULL_43_23]|uniref:DDH domain-containing protein n=1 Tax=Candidatus Doudnabacteria bacterium RIFCSPHIGHO2_01_FULL_43_23 TaxID=1817822 RepID=A0A1F5NRT3_9BACT|nr:MAG: hypothetical protein A2826_00835 [Candidatus Doudnabacteria bacterium RIFCSPHIGHO2_01_FULL_43_23]